MCPCSQQGRGSAYISGLRGTEQTIRTRTLRSRRRGFSELYFGGPWTDRRPPGAKQRCGRSFFVEPGGSLTSLSTHASTTPTYRPCLIGRCCGDRRLQRQLLLPQRRRDRHHHWPRVAGLQRGGHVRRRLGERLRLRELLWFQRLRSL